MRAGGGVGQPRGLRVEFGVYCPHVWMAPDSTFAGGLATTDCTARREAGSSANYYSFNGTAGTTIHVAMTTGAQYYTYLYLLDGTGAVLTPNNCPAPGFTSCLDVTLSATGLYTVEATTLSAVATFAYAFSRTNPQPPTAVTAAWQFRTDGSTPTASWGAPPLHPSE